MTKSIFDPKEVASERTVIISEREGSENEPMFLLGEAVQSASFRVHPYHHEYHRRYGRFALYYP